MEAIIKAAQIIKNTSAILLHAGAGIGVDSGLPDFRSQQGFWKAFPPAARLGISFSQLAEPSWFRKNPKLAWGFYGWRLNQYRQTIPHKGFDIILNWCKQKNDNYFVYTSNVDGQFQKAGFDTEKICECHGSIHFLQCSLPCRKELWSAETFTPAIDEETFWAQEALPKCPHCNSIARPNVLMFGDSSWISTLSDKQEDNFYKWLHQQQSGSFVILEIGAGTSVPTVRNRSDYFTNKYKVPLIRINTSEPFTDKGLSIALPAKEAIQLIDEQIQKLS